MVSDEHEQCLLCGSKKRLYPCFSISELFCCLSQISKNTSLPLEVLIGILHDISINYYCLHDWVFSILCQPRQTTNSCSRQTGHRRNYQRTVSAQLHGVVSSLNLQLHLLVYDSYTPICSTHSTALAFTYFRYPKSTRVTSGHFIKWSRV